MDKKTKTLTNPENAGLYSGDQIMGLAGLILLATAVFACVALAASATAFLVPGILVAGGLFAAGAFGFMGMRGKKQAQKSGTVSVGEDDLIAAAKSHSPELQKMNQKGSEVAEDKTNWVEKTRKGASQELTSQRR